ncbi:MAG: TetR/AcrR family transcriptional regulator [Gammaproteobacteria bacterium]
MTFADKQDARWTRTRSKLLHGGRQVFADRGVEAASVLDIVRAAGVSQPSFYNHFKTKEELAREIVSDYFRNDSRAKQAVFDRIEDPAEAIAINIAQTLSIATNDPVVAWALVRSESLHSLLFSSRNDPLVNMISEGVSKQRFVVDDPHVVALALRGAALAMVQDLLNVESDDEAIRHFQELVLRMLGLTPEESAAVVERVANTATS